ncbi:hypothetical protein [Pseudonocardia acidicola]|uniref:Uncharacterized protein n=1 Tax=Pseudonocardia acidicola TaxID=2724939 RepID=A0ABX1SLM5_9PSEU|nr:hypothetical protein [Pseudonocardia acidicola]NMI01054.1 hypothetical protein [Pseudonocardia acidicola]
MKSHADSAALADCITPLDEEDRAALERYWDQVIEEVWSAVPLRPGSPVVSLTELDERRERREARRAMARIAAAGRVAQVYALTQVADPLAEEAA